VLLPDENQINRKLRRVLLKDEKQRGRFDFDMPQSMLKEMFTEAGMPVIDLLPYFREDPRCLYSNDTHWIPEGHALVAAAIYERLTDEETWPNLATRSDEEGAKATSGREEADRSGQAITPSAVDTR
jgi:hypothetical protein